MFIPGVFQTTRGRHCFVYFISSGLKNIFQEKKNPSTVLKQPWGISERNMKSF